MGTPSPHLLLRDPLIARSSGALPLVAFDVYDLDKDGFISNGELFIVLRTMTGSQLTDVQLQQIVDRTIRDADADGDGRIGFDEFVRFVRGKNSDFLKMWSMADL